MNVLVFILPPVVFDWYSSAQVTSLSALSTRVASHGKHTGSPWAYGLTLS